MFDRKAEFDIYDIEKISICLHSDILENTYNYLYLNHKLFRIQKISKQSVRFISS
jgi:hypothetical protein